MKQRLDLTQLGGLYTYQETLAFMQDAYEPAIDALVQLFGDKVIVQGCVVSGSNISDGWVVFQNKLMFVVGGTVNTYVYVENTSAPEQFADGQQRNVYYNQQLKFTSSSIASIAWSQFKRLPYTSNTIYDALATIKDITSKVIGLEPFVILSGCIISSVNTVASTVTISTGSVLINGDLVNVNAYSGNFPVYLNSNGGWQTSLPSGSYITFDYDTSQRYADVLRRQQHTSGSLCFSTKSTDLDYFDVASGLGKWRWKGWKLSDETRSRTIVGFDRRASGPSDNVYDNAYNTPLSKGGENNHTLSVGEMPAHRVKLFGNDSSGNVLAADPNSTAGVEGDPGGANGPLKYQMVKVPGDATAGNSSSVGNDLPHNNRQPFVTILVFERL